LSITYIKVSDVNGGNKMVHKKQAVIENG